MNKRCYGYIFARGGSRGVPGKNIRLLAGKPLIAYAIEALRRCRYVERVIVSTDDAAIARVAADFGAETPFLRPAELASDLSPELLAWKHALEKAREEDDGMPDIIVSAPATSPLRIPEDLDAAVEMLVSSGADYVYSVTPSVRNPYFNMVSRDADGRSEVLMKLPAAVSRRQDAPPVYDITTVAYAARAAYIAGCSEALDGDIRSIVVPQERAIDIDSPLDFDFAEFLMKGRTPDENA